MATVNDVSQLALGRPMQSLAASRKLVVFHLGAQSYGIALEDVQEILPLAELSRPPTSPPLLAGFVTIGVETIPVISLNLLFGFPEPPRGLYTPMILLHPSCTRVALLVDRVSQIISLTDEAISPVCNGYSLNNCAMGVVRREDGPILLLSPEQLLLEQERRRLNELAATERSRLDLLPGGLA